METVFFEWLGAVEVAAFGDVPFVPRTGDVMSSGTHTG
jgi:hypothetical protein